jgi:hypothetical protein
MSSHPDVFLGAAYWIQGDGNHPAFVLSDPSQTGGESLFIRFTSYVPERHEGREVFTNIDFPDLRHESVVHYYGTRIATALSIQSGVNDGYFEVLNPLPTDVLKRIVAEAKANDDFAPKFMRKLPPDDHPSLADEEE